MIISWNLELYLSQRRTTLTTILSPKRTQMILRKFQSQPPGPVPASEAWRDASWRSKFQKKFRFFCFDVFFRVSKSWERRKGEEEWRSRRKREESIFFEAATLSLSNWRGILNVVLAIYFCFSKVSLLNRTKVTLLWAFQATYKAIWGVFRKVLAMGSAPDRKTWIN